MGTSKGAPGVAKASGVREQTTVIPPKRNRKVQRSYDVDLYKERNLIERFFNKLKQFRLVATRYDKLLANFMGFVKLAAIAIWLR
jgi:putative transposase